MKLKGMLASSIGFREKHLNVEEGINIYGLLDILQISMKSSWIGSSVNNSVVNKKKELVEGDVVEIFILGGGG